MPTTVNAAEIDQFQKDSATWWDERGPFAPLHALNPVRMEFMIGVLGNLSLPLKGEGRVGVKVQQS